MECRDRPHKRRFGAADVVGHRRGFGRDSILVERHWPVLFAGAGDHLGAFPAFSLLRSNIAGLAGATSFTDTNAVGAAPRFYRVRVEQ